MRIILVERGTLPGTQIAGYRTALCSNPLQVNSVPDEEKWTSQYQVAKDNAMGYAKRYALDVETVYYIKRDMHNSGMYTSTIYEVVESEDSSINYRPLASLSRLPEFETENLGYRVEWLCSRGYNSIEDVTQFRSLVNFIEALILDGGFTK